MLWCCSILEGGNATVSALTKKYQEAQLEYLAKERSARAAFVLCFDSVAEKVRRTPLLNSDLKQNKTESLSAAKKRFVESGELPQCMEMLGPVIAYQETLRQARQPLRRVYERLMKQALMSRDDSLLKANVERHTEFGRLVTGHEGFLASSEWYGTRFPGSGGGIRTHMVVRERQGTTFWGHVWQGDWPEEEFIVEGTLDGNYIQFQTTQVVRGGKCLLRYCGFVLNNRMILRVSGVDSQGKPFVNDFGQMCKK